MTSNRFLLPMLIVFAIVLTACDIRIRAGSPPNISALESKIELQSSTKNDVREAVGKPFGKGRAMFPFQPSPRDVWSYYYEEGDMNDDRRTFVFVFFDRDQYDGYIWFSSLPQ